MNMNLDKIITQLKEKGLNIATHGSVIILVKNKEGKYLILQRSKDDEDGALLWDFAGGSSDSLDPLDDAKRELFEETGILVDSLELINHSTYICPWKLEEKARFIFFVEINQECELSFEHDDFKWIEPDKVINYEFYKKGLQEILINFAYGGKI